jgi:hypothetical protein
VNTFDDEETNVLIDRIERLERRNRGLTWAILGAVALPASLLAGGALAAPKAVVVEATQFVLTDGAGNRRGEFAVGPDGAGRIILYGSDGKPVTKLPFEPQMVPLRQ